MWNGYLRCGNWCQGRELPSLLEYDHIKTPRVHTSKHPEYRVRQYSNISPFFRRFNFAHHIGCVLCLAQCVTLLLVVICASPWKLMDLSLNQGRKTCPDDKASVTLRLTGTLILMRVGEMPASWICIIYDHFVPHRECSVLPLERPVGEGCVGETVARNLTCTLCGQAEELLMLSWAIHKYTCFNFWQYLADFFLQWEILRAKVVERIKRHILCLISLSRKSCFWDNVEKVW